jgi:hypothetical protein
VAAAENPRNGGVSLVPGRGQMWAVHDGGGQGPVTSVTPGDAKENSPQTPHKENIYSGGQGWARAPACEGAPGDGGVLPDRRRAKRKGRRRAAGGGDALPHIGLAGDALPESFDKPGEAQFCAIVRRAMASAMGAGTYRAWLDPCRIAIHDGWISIFPPSPVIGDWLGNNHIDRMRLVARRFNLKVEIRRDEAGRRRAASAG